MLCLHGLNIHTEKWYFLKDQKLKKKKWQTAERAKTGTEAERRKCVVEDNLPATGKDSIKTRRHFVLSALRQGGTLFLLPISCPDLLYYGAAITDSQAPFLQEFQDLYLSNWNQGMR